MNIESRLVAVVLLFCCSAVFAGATGHELLFGNLDEGLSEKDKEEIFLALGYQLTPDGRGLASKDCGAVGFAARVIDLNGDGTPEVFVISGNTCTSGNTGTSVDLFVKGAERKYRRQLGFPASGFEVLEERYQGYPDLLFSGPGSCHGAWRWTGTKYEYLCSQESQLGACAKKNVKSLCKRR